VETIDDVPFIQLNMRDCGFCRFVGGLSKDIRGNSWMTDVLQPMRNKAQARAAPTTTTDDHPKELFEGSTTEAPLTVWERRKQLMKLKTNVDTPSYVVLPLAAFSYAGNIYPDTDLKVKVEWNHKKCVSVALSAVALTYIRGRILQHGDIAEQVRRVASVLEGIPGIVRWKPDKRAWEATSQDIEATEQRYKIVRPTDVNDPADVQHALDYAVRWARGEMGVGANLDAVADGAADDDADAAGVADDDAHQCMYICPHRGAEAPIDHPEPLTEHTDHDPVYRQDIMADRRAHIDQLAQHVTHAGGASSPSHKAAPSLLQAAFLRGAR
jgi:hypothetical protein